MAHAVPGHVNPGAQHVDIFIKITAQIQGVITGESLDIKHKGEIQAESFHWEIKQPVDMTSGFVAAGKRQYSFFVFRMKSQVASVKLMNAIITGEPLKEVIITCRKAGKSQQEYLVYKLNTCMVAQLESGYLEDGDIAPSDLVSLTFRKFECTAKAQNADGTLGAGVVVIDEWNVH